MSYACRPHRSHRSSQAHMEAPNFIVDIHCTLAHCDSFVCGILLSDCLEILPTKKLQSSPKSDHRRPHHPSTPFVAISTNMLQTETPPAFVSSVLLSYDRFKDEKHPVTVTYHSKPVSRAINCKVKTPLISEELKQELRTMMKSGRKLDYDGDQIDCQMDQ